MGPFVSHQKNAFFLFPAQSFSIDFATQAQGLFPLHIRDGGNGAGAEKSPTPQILADQLTLSQSGGGGRLCPHTSTPPPDFQT